MTGYSVREPKGAVLLYFASLFSAQGEERESPSEGI